MLESRRILPFISKSVGASEQVPEGFEAASILCLSEGERKKAGFLSGKEETLTSISKLYYPLWGIPHENKCFLIDGMGIHSSKIRYPQPPDVENFIEHIKRNASVQELYQSTLEGHRDTFATFSSEMKVPIDGFLMDEELHADILDYLGQSKTQRRALETESRQSSSRLVPVIDETSATEVGLKIITHCTKLQSDIESFRIAAEVLRDETTRHLNRMEQEIEEVQEAHRQQISDARTRANEQKNTLEKNLKQKLQKLSKTHEQEMKIQLSEKRKLSGKLLKLEQNKAECERRKNLRRKKKDEVGEARWDAKLRNICSQAASEKRKLKTLSKLITRMNKEIARTTKKLRYECEKKVEVEDRKVAELETVLNKEIARRQATMSDLQKRTQTIIAKIKGLENRDQQEIAGLERAALAWEIRSQTLLYIPFYMIHYITDKDERLSFYFPFSTKFTVGLAIKIRKAIGGSNLSTRIGSTLIPHFRVIKATLTRLGRDSEKSRLIQNQLETLKVSNNLLQYAQFKQLARKGVDNLERKGVIRNQEKNYIIKTYLE
ncbi:MAG: hypothetical protein JSV35_01445 [Candidatus Bathyarchaeota archaeon]|nr:MAG: hypothetical protein JSV35_01445 [Candidatus Bathyarchaeota archaeon]